MRVPKDYSFKRFLAKITSKTEFRHFKTKLPTSRFPPLFDEKNDKNDEPEQCVGARKIHVSNGGVGGRSMCRQRVGEEWMDGREWRDGLLGCVRVSGCAAYMWFLYTTDGWMESLCLNVCASLGATRLASFSPDCTTRRGRVECVGCVVGWCVCALGLVLCVYICVREKCAANPTPPHTHTLLSSHIDVCGGCVGSAARHISFLLCMYVCM